MKKRVLNRDTIFIVSAFLLLLISYSFNPFGITSDSYQKFDKGDESNIISRLMMSRDEGILSHGGLTGSYFHHQYELEEGEEKPLIYSIMEEGDSATIANISPLALIAQNYDDYIKNRKIYGGEWNSYKTQPGGQAFMYVVLDNILPFNNGIKLSIFRLITILLSVAVFILFVKWVLNNWGFLTAFVTFILIFITPWVFGMAYNLWWALWSFYIPFITMLFVLDRRRKENKYHLDFKVYAILFLTVFLKFFFTGAEFITTTLIMSVCPVIFHLIATKTELRSGILQFLKASLTCILGILAGMLLLVIQIRMEDGTWMAGIDHILFSFTKRSAYANDMESVNVIDVITMYLNEEAFSKISVGLVCILFTLSSIFVFVFSKIKGTENLLLNKALAVTATISILAPLSWFVIFAQHSHTHLVIDNIVWYMPYFLYGYCVIGVALQLGVSALKKKYILKNE